MRWWVYHVLLTLQIIFFLVGRIFDDLSWYYLDFDNKQATFQAISAVTLSIAIILNFIRKWPIDGIMKIMFFRSQIKFVIPWSLNILTIILFLNTFGCQPQKPENDQATVFLFYDSCVIYAIQLLLTNLTYSFATNTKTHTAQLIAYEIVLFGQIIFDARLLMEFIHKFSQRQKELSLILMSVVFANQIMMMDLMYRGAHEDRELQETAEKIGMNIVMVNDEAVNTRKMTSNIKMTDFRLSYLRRKLMRQ